MLTHLPGFSLNERCAAAYGNRFCDSTHLHQQVDPNVRAGIQPDTRSFIPFESRHLGRYLVSADGKSRGIVPALVVGKSGPAHSPFYVRENHLGARHHRPGSILHPPGNRAFQDLRE